MNRNGTIATSINLIAVILCAVIIFMPASVRADKPTEGHGMPRSMLYEGYITDSRGNPLSDGNYDFTFALYTAETGGAPVWTEEHKNVKVTDGAVRVHLGKGTTPHPLSIPFDKQYYLGIRIGSDSEMVPRLELSATAYSFRAAIAEDVVDEAITTAKIAPGAVTDDKIESVGWDKIVGAPATSVTALDKSKPGPVPANVWHTRGNTKTNPDRDYLGTADPTALLFKTDAIERMSIDADGRVFIRSDLQVDGYVTSRVSPTEGGFLLADPEHGLKRTGNDDVHLYTTNGSILLEGGDVGVGAAAPTARLHVEAAPGAEQALRVATGATDRFTVAANGRVYINSSVSGVDTDVNSYPVLIDCVDQGVAIRIRGDSQKENNFVSFWDGEGLRGRIEGLDVEDLVESPEYIYTTAIDGIEMAIAVAELVGASSSANACVGFGVVACPPVPSLIVAAAANVALQAVRIAATQAFQFARLGVSYESGTGDYAEWLERRNEGEVFEPGDVVGVFGGKIAKATDGAQQVLAVSSTPIVLGNMPPEGEKHRYEKVAFMGQVRVKVIGPVEEGDYIIPSGLDDGTGIAVAPSLMTADEFAKALGRAWESSSSDRTTYINVVMGLNQGDVSSIIQAQQDEITQLRSELAARSGDARATRAALNELRDRVAELGALRDEVRLLRALIMERRSTGPATVREAAAGSIDRTNRLKQ